MTAIYRGMDRATLDAAYDNAAAVPDTPAYRARWDETSKALRAKPSSRLDLRFGERPRATLDYFPAKAGAPLFVFIHGGYWQRNEKERFAFTALGPNAHGINVAVPGYTLAPQATLTEIVGEIRQALSFLAEHAAELGFDPKRMVVGGWSAGGHLTAAVADHPAFAAGIPISGIFDLEPIRLGVLNDALKLTEDEVAWLSPLGNLPSRSPPLHLLVGGNEQPELRRQAQEYTAAAQARGLPVSLTVLPGHHHFSILDELESPDGALTKAVVQMIERLG